MDALDAAVALGAPGADAGVVEGGPAISGDDIEGGVLPSAPTRAGHLAYIESI